MTTLALTHIDTGPGVVATVMASARRHRRLIVGFALLFPVGFYLLLLAVLVVRYGDLPNYVTPYNWPANVWHIIVSTRAVSDMVPIIADEWLIEIGYMNYDYGNGIADWSMSIIPHKLAVLSLTGALVGLNAALMIDRKASASLATECTQACRTGLLTGGGAISASLTSATIFSIACCATPSWVGSLAVLGLETTAAFALEPYGLLASVGGMAALAISALLIARDGGANNAAPLPSPKGAV